jgi:hypothetical protein
MDPVTLAIIAAIAAGLAKGAGDVAQSAVGDAYRGLKQLLARKFGHTSDVVKAVDDAEAKPESEARKSVLREEIEASGAGTDPEIVAAAQQLLEHLGNPAGGSNVQQAKGSYIAQAAQGGSAQVHIGSPPGEPER